MKAQIQLGDIALEVRRKDIKNVHLSVHPPAGRVSVSAPARMSLETIRVFAIAKLPWIRQQQRKMQQQDRETPREYLDRESHYVWGRRCLLKVIEHDGSPSINLVHNQLRLFVRPHTQKAKYAEAIQVWYRELIRQEAEELLIRWEPRLGVKSNHLYIQHMKTRWGSCNSESGNIRLNTELAKKPRECLEFVLVHELIHLIEPTHNANFLKLMDQYLPRWQERRQTLNRLPVRHEEWGY